MGVPPNVAFPGISARTGVPVYQPGNGLHKIKDAAGLSGSDDVLVDDDGNVYIRSTGEEIGNVVDEAYG